MGIWGEAANSVSNGGFPLTPTRLRQGYGGQALPRKGGREV